MATYQRKLVEVEAIQWTGDNLEAVQAVAPDAFFGCPDFAYDYLHPVMSLWTKHAYGQRCEVGDWVVRRRDVSRIKPDVFEATYEPTSTTTPEASPSSSRSCSYTEAERGETLEGGASIRSRVDAGDRFDPSRFSPADPSSFDCALHGLQPEMWVCPTCLNELLGGVARAEQRAEEYRADADALSGQNYLLRAEAAERRAVEAENREAQLLKALEEIAELNNREKYGYQTLTGAVFVARAALGATR